MDSLRPTVAAHIRALRGRFGDVRVSRHEPPWLWVRRLAVPLRAGGGTALNLTFRLPPMWPAQPPRGFYTRLGNGWTWHPLALVNWDALAPIPLRNFLIRAGYLLHHVLSLPPAPQEIVPIQRFYHGTSLARANSILACGFRTQGHYGGGEGRVYFSRDPNYSWPYSQMKSLMDSSGQALLVCRIDLTRYHPGLEYQADGAQVVFFRRPVSAGVVVEIQRR